MRTGVLGAALPLLLACSRLAAQQPRDTVRLDTLVVTATPLPSPRDAVAAPVTVLTARDLSVRGIVSVYEALRAVAAAVVVQAGSYGAPASLFLRGGESDHVRVLVDGIPVNLPGGSMDLAHISTDGVERVEIVRGPGSVLHGSDAMAGVVQVVTLGARGGPRWSAEASAGSYGTTRLAAGLSGGGERAGLGASVSRVASDGSYPWNSGYRRTEASALLRAGAPGAAQARLSVRAGEHRTHFPTDGAGALSDRNQYTDGRVATVGLEVLGPVGPRLRARLLAGLHSSDAGYDDRPDGAGDTLGLFAYRSSGGFRRRILDLRASAVLSPGATATAGAAFERQTEASRDSSDSEYGASATSSSASRRNAALYADVQAGRGGPLAVQLGARHDRNQRFGGFTTVRAGLVWRAARGVRLRAAGGSAFKEPTFVEQFASGYATGDPSLRPERSLSLEAGLELSAVDGAGVLSAAWFSQRLRDLVLYRYTEPGSTDPSFVNLAGADTRGIELGVSSRLSAALTADAHYTYLWTRVTDTGGEGGPGTAFEVGRPLLRRPAHSGGAGVRLAGTGGSAALSASWIGRRDDLDYSSWPAVRVRLSSYVRVDAAAALRLPRPRARAAGLSGTVRVENLLGARYEEARGFAARGRTVTVGVRLEGGTP